MVTIVEEEGKILGIDQSKLIPVLTKSLQDAWGQIDSCKEIIEELRKEIFELKSQLTNKE